MSHVKSNSRIDDVGAKITFPPLSPLHTPPAEAVTPEGESVWLPGYFVVNIQMSCEKPSVFHAKEDGVGYNLAFVFRISEEVSWGEEGGERC